MELDAARSYIVFGATFVVSLIIFVRSDHLWKDRFRKQSLYAAAVVLLIGIALEFSDLLNQKRGLVIVVMSVPAIYLAYFLTGRNIFMRLYGTEPYVTSSSSTVGSSPLDLYTATGKDGRKRKFDKTRRIMRGDFVFSFVSTLGAVFTIMFLVYLVTILNS